MLIYLLAGPELVQVQPVRGLVSGKRVSLDAPEEQPPVDRDQGSQAPVQLRRVPSQVLQEQLPAEALSAPFER